MSAFISRVHSSSSWHDSVELACNNSYLVGEVLRAQFNKLQRGQLLLPHGPTLEKQK